MWLTELFAPIQAKLTRFGTFQSLWRHMLPIVCGALLALAQSPFSQFWIVFLVLPLVFSLVSNSASNRAAAMIGWLLGTGYFVVALSWITQPFLVDVERHGWMAPFALVFMAGGLALFWATAFFAARYFAVKNYALIAALAGFWTLSEYARSTLFTGFPWALIGYGWIETPLAQNAAWSGPHGLGLITLLSGLSLAIAMPRSLFVSIVSIAALWILGVWQVPDVAALRADGFVVRLIQPNADQSLKWDADWVAKFYQRQLDYSVAKTETPPDVVIWPETSVPFILSTSQGALAEIASYAKPARVIMGIRELQGEPGQERLFNSLVLLDQTGAVTARYDKYHLVPFGEYIPFARWLSGFDIGPLTAENLFGFSAGNGPVLVQAVGVPAFLPLICYEAIFPAGMQAPEGRAEWLVQVTNDAWFGKLTGPYQHLAQARMRAIEQGLPLARSANTGISAMIDPYGRLTHSIDLGIEGFVDSPLPMALAPTPYSRYGDIPALLAAMLMIGFALASLRSHKPLTISDD